MSKLKLGIIGCGAATEILHLPAASITSEVTVTHLADLSAERAEHISLAFSIPSWDTDWHKMIGSVDAVLISTPPHTHAEIAVEAMEAGLDVLCEKPLATTMLDVDHLISAANKTGRHLSVGHARRWFWNTQFVKQLLDNHLFGDVVEVSVEEGGRFNWPAQTPCIFEKETGVGVLLANGIHCMDLLIYWFGEKIRVNDYEDDGWHGPEANCRAEFDLSYDDKPVIGTVDFSTTRSVENRIIIKGSRLTAEINPLYEGDDICISPGLQEAFFGDRRLVVAQKGDKSVWSMVRAHAEQLRRFAISCNSGETVDVSAEEARKSLVLIAECYAKRRLLEFPWLPYSGTMLGIREHETAAV